MPIDKAKVVEVHEEIRACFKGHLKSSNKSYALDFKPGAPLQVKPHDAKAGQRGEHWKIVSAMPGPEKREFRNQQTELSSDILKKFRSPKFYCIPLPVHRDPVLRGFEVLNQKDLIGNCYEMAVAAAYVVAQRKVGTPWIGRISRPGDHAFCLVNGGVTPRWKAVEWMRIAQADAWIIDPWANICCKQNEYPARFADQMRIWAHQGKQVWYRDENDVGNPIDPSSPTYLSGFEEGPLRFEKGSGRISDKLPRALQKQRDAQADPLPGAFGRWSPDDDWS